MASAEAIAAADVAKAAANKLYADNKLDEAIESYTTALQLLPELDGSDEDVVASLVGSKEAGLRAILLTNRAQCLLMQVCAACAHAFCLPLHVFQTLHVVSPVTSGQGSSDGGWAAQPRGAQAVHEGTTPAARNAPPHAHVC